MSRRAAFITASSIAAAGLATAGVIHGHRRFRSFVDGRIAALLSPPVPSVGLNELDERRSSLPAPVQRYLEFAIAADAPALSTVRLRHGGHFRTAPRQPWLLIRGDQHFTAARPGFVWSARLKAGPFVWFDACDSLVDGRGNMLVKVQSAFTIADAHGPQIDQGASMRWMMETFWFPYGIVSERIRWEPIDANTATMHLMDTELPVSARVDFNREGRILRLSGDRYRDTGRGGASLTPWAGRCSDYKQFGSFRVPGFVEAAWILPEGEFSYVRFQVTGIEYNLPIIPR